MPFLELRTGLLDRTFLGDGLIGKRLVQLDKSVVCVAEHSNRIPFEVCNVLDLEVLIDLPECGVIVFKEPFVNHLLLVFLA